MRLFCDNRATISIASDSIQHGRMKHIEIDKHFIKEKLKVNYNSHLHTFCQNKSSACGYLDQISM